GQGGQGQDDQGDKGQLPVEPKDRDQDANKDKSVMDDLADAHGDRLLHGGHVVGHAGDELTAAPAGVKVQGQLEQVVVDPRPEVGNHPLADEVHGVGLRVDDEALEHHKDDG